MYVKFFVCKFLRDLQPFHFVFKVGLSRLRTFLLNWNFPQSFSKLYHHSFVRCLKLKINEFKNCKICFLKKQADLKTSCTRPWRLILMITYNMLTQKYYFCWWFKSIFKIAYSFWLWVKEIHNYLMITSKIGKAICKLKNSNRTFRR